MAVRKMRKMPMIIAFWCPSRLRLNPELLLRRDVRRLLLLDVDLLRLLVLRLRVIAQMFPEWRL
jgi:hypothetical protein